MRVYAPTLAYEEVMADISVALEIRSPLSLGLIRDDGHEEDDAGYQRAEFVFERIDGGFANAAVLRFGPYRSDAARSLTGVVVFDCVGNMCVGTPNISVLLDMQPLCHEAILLPRGSFGLEVRRALANR